MKKREPYVRKHVHSWKLSKDVPARARSYDYWKQEWVDETPRRLERTCSDCSAVEYGQIWDHNDFVVVKGYESISDIGWYPGKLQEND